MSKIAITDYFEKPSEEIDILGDLVGMQVGEDTEIGITIDSNCNHLNCFIDLIQTPISSK